jgi:hypothetical protein
MEAYTSFQHIPFRLLMLSCRREDPDRPYSFFDLTKDAKVLLPNISECSRSGCFSRVKHWLDSKDEKASLR